MPALRYCGRRWFAASDDFVFFPALFALARLAIVLYAALVFGLPNPRDTWVHAYNSAVMGPPAAPAALTHSAAPPALTPMPNANHVVTMLGAYSLAVVAVDSLCIVSDVALALASFRGSVLEPAARAHFVAIALTVRIAFAWFELGTAIFGAVFAYNAAINDPRHFLDHAPLRRLLTPLKVVNGLQFSFVAVIAVAFVSYLDFRGHKDPRSDPGYASEWGRRCKLCFCCVWAEKKATRIAHRARTRSMGLVQQRRSPQRSASGASGGGDDLCVSGVLAAGEVRTQSDEFDIASVAELFANMFRNVDLVPSDIAAGLVLLRKKQKLEAARAKQQRERAASFSPVLVERSRVRADSLFKVSTQHTERTRKLLPADVAVLREAAHYMNFAIGAYGWPMAAMAHPGTFIPKLCGNCFCGAPPPAPGGDAPAGRRSGEGGMGEPLLSAPGGCCGRGENAGDAPRVPSYIGDNLCHCNVAAMRFWLSHAAPPPPPRGRGGASDDVELLASLGLRSRAATEILYYSRSNDVFVVPFFIAHDLDRRVLVVSVRGTLSLHDAFTDLNALPHALRVAAPHGSDAAPGREVDGFAHWGMQRSAAALVEQLLRPPSPSSVEAGVEVCHLPTLFSRKRYSGFRLVVTGHSLGAGVAAIVGCMLVGQFPTLRVFAFSPPGGLLSAELAALSEQFTTSIVVGKDLVPRLSEISIAEMRDDLMAVLAETTRSKATILGSCCAQDPLFLLNRRQPPADAHGRPEEEAQLRLRKHRAEVAREAPRMQLLPPGVVWHLQKTHSTRRQRCCGTWCEPLRGCSVCGCVDRREAYFPIVVPRTHFARVLVSPIMVKDHMPWNVRRVLEQVVSDAESGALDLIADELGSDDDDSDDGDVDLVVPRSQPALVVDHAELRHSASITASPSDLL